MDVLSGPFRMRLSSEFDVLKICKVSPPSPADGMNPDMPTSFQVWIPTCPRISRICQVQIPLQGYGPSIIQ